MGKMWEPTARHKMQTNRGTVRIRLILVVLGLVLRSEAQIPVHCILSDSNRPPENSDITVTCGSQSIDLSILLCPVYQAFYNESLLVLNGQFSRPACSGTADFNALPPVLRFRIPLNDTAIAACGNSLKILGEGGTGAFSDYSNVQIVNISGTVTSSDPSLSAITYRSLLLYKFSCRYPLLYLMNNTQMSVSGSSIAIRDNNGTFISTLSMHLYRDSQYQDPLVIPPAGLGLKTKIYVAIRAANLTDKFNVLLDRCYTTTSANPMLVNYYDLFVGCTRDAQTKVEVNGISQKAFFSFEAFRFTEHKNLSVSTFYLHCATRLCDVSSCSSSNPPCPSRAKREIQDDLPSATITSPAIIVSEEAQTNSVPNAVKNEVSYSSPVFAVIIGIAILTIVIITMACYFLFCIQRRKRPVQ